MVEVRRRLYFYSHLDLCLLSLRDLVDVKRLGVDDPADARVAARPPAARILVARRRDTACARVPELERASEQLVALDRHLAQARVVLEALAEWRLLAQAGDGLLRPRLGRDGHLWLPRAAARLGARRLLGGLRLIGRVVGILRIVVGGRGGSGRRVLIRFDHFCTLPSAAARTFFHGEAVEAFVVIREGTAIRAAHYDGLSVR